MQKEGVTVTNIMADGTICEDLSQYRGVLPDAAVQIILRILKGDQKQCPSGTTSGNTGRPQG